MKLPKHICASLNAATGLCKAYINNQVAQTWLTDKLGLVMDDNEHDLGDFTVDFCWAQQRWYVK